MFNIEKVAGGEGFDPTPWRWFHSHIPFFTK